MSEDERRLLALVVDGHSLVQAADNLHRSPEETRRMKAALITKLRAGATADLVRIGLYARAAPGR